VSDPTTAVEKDAFVERETASNAPSGGLSPEIGASLLAFFTRDPSDYDDQRLHYGSDLSPESCERKTWYRLHGVARDPSELGSEIRFHGGRVWEKALLDALEANGVALRRVRELTDPRTGRVYLKPDAELVMHPLRPSAWAWVGHADAIMVKERKLLECKAPRAGLFARAKNDPRKLVKASYAWQASAYFWELRRTNRIDSAAFVFIDREGANRPVEVPLEGDLLIPLEKIVEQEAARARLLTLAEVPERKAGTLVVEVLKGRAKKNPVRTVRATETRYALCSYCPFQGVCQPGPEERDVTLAPERQAAEIARAEALWKQDGKAKAVFRYGADEDAESEDFTPVVETTETPEEPVALTTVSEAPPQPEIPPVPSLVPPDPAAAGLSFPSPSDPVEEARALVAEASSSTEPGKDGAW
jgi:hypothetical protein